MFRGGSSPNLFDLRPATVSCLGHRFSKRKMTRYAENSGGHGPLATPMYPDSKVGGVRFQ